MKSALHFAILLNLVFSSFVLSQGGVNAIRFDGVDDAVRVPASASLNVQSYTYESWVYWTTATCYVIAEWNREVNEVPAFGPNFGTWSDGVIFGNSTEMWEDLVSSPPNTILLNHWIHLAFTYDYASGIEKIFANGTEVAQKNVGQKTLNTAAPFNFFIGRRPADHNGPSEIKSFSGSIDEVRLWNVSRTETGIRENMHQCLTGSESGLAGYWRFDGGTGVTASDSSINGNDGTLINDPAWEISTAPFGDMGAFVSTSAPVSVGPSGG